MKLTEAFSLKRISDIKKIVSTSYYFVAAVSFLLGLFFFISNIFFNWGQLLNINQDYISETNYAIIVLVIFVLFIFFIKLIGEIYTSLQLPFVDNIIKTSSSIIFFIVIITLYIFNIESSLIFISIFSIAPLFLIYSILTFYFFKVKSPSLIPKVIFISKGVLRQILKPGLSFFLINIAGIILNYTDSLIILKLLSANDVADYSIYYKYYSFPFIFFNLYIASHWSSFIDAIAKEDYFWIKNKIRLFNRLFLLLIFSYIFLFIYNEELINIWIGKNKINDNTRLSLYMIIYFLVSSYTTIYIYVINANGKLKIQLYGYSIIALINIPLSIFLVRYFEMGTSGVILASAICLFILLVLIPIQYYKIINRKALGIWNK